MDMFEREQDLRIATLRTASESEAVEGKREDGGVSEYIRECCFEEVCGERE